MGNLREFEFYYDMQQVEWYDNIYEYVCYGNYSGFVYRLLWKWYSYEMTQYSHNAFWFYIVTCCFYDK